MIIALAVEHEAKLYHRSHRIVLITDSDVIDFTNGKLVRSE